MNRSIILALSLACSFNAPTTKANFKEDLLKVAAGAGVGYGVSSLITLPSNLQTSFAQFTTFLGMAVAMRYTSYGRYVIAQWNFSSIDPELMSILKNTSHNSDQLKNSIDAYYIKYQYSLLTAYDDLVQNDSYLARAEDFFQCVENSFLHDAQWTAYIKTTLVEIAQLRSLITPALITIKQDPRWIAMLAARNAAEAAEKAAAIAQQQLRAAQAQLREARHNNRK